MNPNLYYACIIVLIYFLFICIWLVVWLYPIVLAYVMFLLLHLSNCARYFSVCQKPTRSFAERETDRQRQRESEGESERQRIGRRDMDRVWRISDSILSVVLQVCLCNVLWHCNCLLSLSSIVSYRLCRLCVSVTVCVCLCVDVSIWY